MVPKALRTLFVVHFVADLIAAIPLWFAPEATLRAFGWTAVDPIATRLVAAALFGIGIESLIGRNASIEQFRGMLNLKVIWSSAATLGTLVSVLQPGAPKAGYAVLAIFAMFCGIWTYFRIRLRPQNAPAQR